jgi:Signal transduction histidine kinase
MDSFSAREGRFGFTDERCRNWLSVVHDLVKQHGGKVWVEENPDGGARFIAEFEGATQV